MVDRRSIDLVFGPSGPPPALTCELCGYTPIKFGLTICQGCRQGIEYVDHVKKARPSFSRDIMGAFIGVFLLWIMLAFGITFIFGREYSWISSLIFVLLVFAIPLAYYQRRKDYRARKSQGSTGQRLVTVIFGDKPKTYTITSTSTGAIFPLNHD